MLSRQQIRQFLAVVDMGNFTRAADALGVTQPTLSNGIRELEGHVGARLFDRQKPAVRLTSAGNRLLPVARRIDREFRRAETETAEAPAQNRPFIVGVLPSIATHLLKAALSHQPVQSLEIREKDGAILRRELRKGSIDAALIMAAGSGNEGLELLPLYDEPYRLMLPENHRLAHRKSIHAEELADEVMIARRACEQLNRTSRFFTSRGVRPQFAFKSRNDDRAMALVAAGLGLTVAPHSLVRDGVCSIELAEFNLQRSVAIAGRQDDLSLGGNYRRRIEAISECFITAHQQLGLAAPAS